MTPESVQRNVVTLALAERTGQLVIDAGEALPVPIGIATVSALFRRDPPHEADLEAAIDVIEEAVMPLAKSIPASSKLVAGNEFVRNLIDASTGRSESASASIEAVESRFEELAAAARRGVWTGAARMDSTQAAGLMILREFMHHTGFDRIERSS